LKTNSEEFLSEKIIQRICECGWDAYLCGGAVRDEFLDAQPNDFDIVTDALPEELEKIFPDYTVKTFGISFLVTSVAGIDVATYRSDRNSGPGRFNCITEACQTLDEDLSRRDFTFNALAVCPYTGEIVDPFDGRKDLEKKVVRFVGDADKRIYEDPLRMIRAARFTCLIEGKLDITSFKAIYNNRGKVKDISPERIRIELLKVMKYKTPSIFFDVLYETGLMKILFPELEAMYGHTGGKFHNETLDQHFKITGDVLSSKDPVLRLTGYLHDIGKPVVYDGESFIDHEKVGADMARRILKRYKFTIKETTRCKRLVRYHMRSMHSLITDKAIRRMLKVFTDNHISFKDWLRLKIADRKANLALDDYTLGEIKSFCIKVHNASNLTDNGGFKITDLKVNGNDVMNILNIKQGKLVGDILKYLLSVVIDDPDKNEKDVLTEIIRETKLMEKGC